MKWANPNSSVGIVADSRIGRWFDPRLDDCHCDMIHSSLTAVRFFFFFLTMVVGKQQLAWKEYYAEYWLKELQELAVAIQLKYC